MSDDEWGTTFFAPEDGYKPKGNFANNNGPDVVQKALFIKSGHGQVYSKLGFLFHINNTPDATMSVTIRGVANTNGSRNWEATAPQQ